MRINLDELRGHCFSCLHDFPVVALPDMSYGDWLLRSNDGKINAIMHLLDNPVFEEVERLVQLEFDQTIDDFELGKLMGSIIDIACDKVCQESIGLTPRRCPFCASTSVDEFDFTPPRMFSLDLPLVTHHEWNAKTNGEKQRAVNFRLKSIGALPP